MACHLDLGSREKRHTKRNTGTREPIPISTPLYNTQQTPEPGYSIRTQRAYTQVPHRLDISAIYTCILPYQSRHVPHQPLHARTLNQKIIYHQLGDSSKMSSSQPARPSYFLSSFLAAFRQAPTQSAAPLTTQASKHTTTQTPPSRQTPQPQRQAPTVSTQVSLHSSTRGAHSAIPIPGGGGRRRSDSSSEGFREVNPAGGPWYIGGRTAAGEEKFFKLGVVRRVRSIDRLSLDRLSL